MFTLGYRMVPPSYVNVGLFIIYNPHQLIIVISCYIYLININKNQFVDLVMFTMQLGYIHIFVLSTSSTIEFSHSHISPERCTFKRLRAIPTPRSPRPARHLTEGQAHVGALPSPLIVELCARLGV